MWSGELRRDELTSTLYHMVCQVYNHLFLLGKEVIMKKAFVAAVTLSIIIVATLLAGLACNVHSGSPEDDWAPRSRGDYP